MKTRIDEMLIEIEKKSRDDILKQKGFIKGRTNVWEEAEKNISCMLKESEHFRTLLNIKSQTPGELLLHFFSHGARHCAATGDRIGDCQWKLILSLEEPVRLLLRTDDPLIQYSRYHTDKETAFERKNIQDHDIEEVWKIHLLPIFQKIAQAETAIPFFFNLHI